MLSDAAEITTRMGINNDGFMIAEMTIFDEEALTAPWVVTKQFRKTPDSTWVYDYACNENIVILSILIPAGPIQSVLMGRS